MFVVFFLWAFHLCSSCQISWPEFHSFLHYATWKDFIWLLEEFLKVDIRHQNCCQRVPGDVSTCIDYQSDQAIGWFIQQPDSPEQIRSIHSCAASLVFVHTVKCHVDFLLLKDIARYQFSSWNTVCQTSNCGFLLKDPFKQTVCSLGNELLKSWDVT